MKVTTKGQVTIPQTIREEMRIYPGSEVEFTIEGEGVMMKPVKRVEESFASALQRLIGSGTVKMTTDEILALTRGE